MISIKPKKASEIAKIVSGKLIGKDCLINKISLSSNENMEFGTCFVGLKGKKYDGNDFVIDALSRGADVVMTEREIIHNKTSIVVDDTKISLLKLAKACIGKTKIIGITGSVGKTTVKNMIISVLGQRYSVTGTKENENNEIGVAKTLLSIKNEDFCVVEMGMRAQGEIDLLASFALPEVAVITNIKTSHIERLGSEENILKAKLEILNYKPKYAILPNDTRLKNLDYGEVKSIFIDFALKEGQYTFFDNGIEFCIDDDTSSSLKMKIYSFCLHNIHNARISYLVGKLYGLTNDEIANGLSQFKRERMREQYLNINGITIINDCYNSSYDSLKSALISVVNFSKIKGKRVNVLIGDILELGEYSEEIHTKIGRLCRNLEIDRLYLFGEDVIYVKNGAGYGEIFKKKEELIKELCEKLNENDVLLVKASRELRLERIIEGIKKFNE